MTPSNGFALGISCCYCGGKLQLDAASIIHKCDHCGSCLRIVGEESSPTYIITDNSAAHEIKYTLDRELKRRNLPLASRWESIAATFVPFWNIKGTIIQIRRKTAASIFRELDFARDNTENLPNTEVSIKSRQVSLCADGNFDWMIETLGVRTQVLELMPLESSHLADSRFAPVTISEPEAFLRFEKSAGSAASIRSDSKHKCSVNIIGRKSMLVYFPIWIAIFSNADGMKQVFFDPLAERLLNLIEIKEDVLSPHFATPTLGAGVRVEAHRCPDCGIDFPAVKNGIVAHCQNCNRLYHNEHEQFRRFDFHLPETFNEKDTLFPFWLFDLSGNEWANRNKLISDLQLIGFNTEQFIVPAFHVSNPTKLLRLVAQYNRHERDFRSASQPKWKSKLVEVVISQSEAAQLIPPLIIGSMALKGYESGVNYENFLPPGKFPSLIWRPFSRDRYFWRDSIIGAAIEKAVIRI